MSSSCCFSCCCSVFGLLSSQHKSISSLLMGSNMLNTGGIHHCKIAEMQEEIDELRECIRYIFGETLKTYNDVSDAPKWAGTHTKDLPVRELIGFVRLAHKYRPRFMREWKGHMGRWERQGEGCFAFAAFPTCKCLQYLRPTSLRQNQSCPLCRELPQHCQARSRCALCGECQHLKGCGGNVLAIFCTNEACLYYIDSMDHRIKVSHKDTDLAKYAYILSTGTELKLEEKPHKFKVGDVIADDYETVLVSDKRKTEDYLLDPERANAPEQTYHLATPEEITKWNKEVLEPNHLHYSKSKRKIIHWFLPFDKVVVREEDGKWHASLFSDFDKDNEDDMPYLTLGGSPWYECLPYNDKTAKLIGTTDDYEE